MRSQLRRFFDAVREHRYHRDHRDRALHVLTSLSVARRGGLDVAARRSCDEYARDVLGWAGYAPWLYVYSAVAGAFREGWIPDNYYGRVVVPILKGEYGRVSTLKPLSRTLLHSKTLPDLYYFVNGLWFTPDREILSDEQVRRAVRDQSQPVVFKTDGSLQGQGVTFFDAESFDLERVRTLGNGVLQERIQQHPFFAGLSPNSTATLRMTTVVHDTGDVSLRACYLRLGRHADSHVRSATHIRIPVDPATGVLATTAFLPDWSTTSTHPDTGSGFGTLVLPEFGQCVDAALELQRAVPYARSVGWDMVVDVEGRIRLMEWNGGHNDIKFSEATQGPCFADLGWEKLWRSSVAG